eukprot:m.137105 g.137105  ORF g.137105 m.137105 type:complete len:67 (+) comp29904_c1_seq5:585-785(+)
MIFYHVAPNGGDLHRNGKQTRPQRLELGGGGSGELPTAEMESLKKQLAESEKAKNEVLIAHTLVFV